MVFEYIIIHGVTCSYMAPTYLRRLYKYVYNKHMDILSDIEGRKVHVPYGLFFCSSMFATAFS